MPARGEGRGDLPRSLPESGVQYAPPTKAPRPHAPRGRKGDGARRQPKKERYEGLVLLDCFVSLGKGGKVALITLGLGA